jgi:1,4-dihydroxy-6-naphthoate synthase
MRRSVEFALNNPAQTLDYVRPHAQEMNTEVMMKHIGLYVNNYTVNLGEKGRKAIHHLFKTARDLGIVPLSSANLFIQN